MLQGFAKGHRFGLWVKPKDHQVRAAILAVQTHGEENSAVRPILLRAALRLAAKGIVTLILDPYGTGDSAGESYDARLNDWRSDFMRAAHLIRTKYDAPFFIWGIRLGTLMATDLLITQSDTTKGILMWAPLAHGRSWLDQSSIDKSLSSLLLRASKTLETPAVLPEAPLDDLNSLVQIPPEEDGSPLLTTLDGTIYQAALLEEIRHLSLAPVKSQHQEQASARIGLFAMTSEPADPYKPSLSRPAPLALETMEKAWKNAGYRVFAQAIEGEPFWKAACKLEPLELFEATEHWLETVLHEEK